MRPRPLLVSFCLVAVTVTTGLILRFAPLGLPASIVKYGGSTMWALMIYWLVSVVLPAWRLPAAGLLAAAIATAVEFGKLYRSPTLDAFRLTLPGKLLLGRYFSYWDLVAYWLAIAFGMLVDKAIRSSER